MIHVGHVDEIAETNNPVLFEIDAPESLQEILGPVHALIAATSFCNADAIVRKIRIIDLDQPLVIARMKLSESEGESPLLTHVDAWLVGDMSSFPGGSPQKLSNWAASEAS
jgi:hypothetical protein